MSYTFFKKKPRYGLVLAIKLGVVCLASALLTFLFLKGVFALTDWVDDFEDYSIGILDGQDNWVQLGGTHFGSVQNSVVYEGSKAGAVSNTLGDPFYQLYKTFASSSSGNLTFAFQQTQPTATSSDAVFTIKLSSATTSSSFGFKLEWVEDATSSFDLFYSNGETAWQDYVDDVATGTWHILQIEWNAENDEVRLKIDDHSWTDWQSSASPFDYADRFSFSDVAFHIFYFDSMEFDEDCAFYNDFNSCQTAGCCWSYLPEGLTWGGTTNFCSRCPSGSCGSSWLDCQNCATQETCEAQENCFWYLETCRFGETECSGVSLGLCDNQSGCENAGGYWYDDFCWYSPKPTYFESWEDWYATHGNYATPTAFVSSLASSTQGFFETIGGFLIAFDEFFNLTEAYERGNNLGSALPVARGYLGVFDDFLGGFPIGEIFFIILIFMLVVVVLRLLPKAIALIKFW